jgi:hypothetical protein
MPAGEFGCSATFVYPLSGDFLAVPIKSAYALGVMDNVTGILDAIAEGDPHTMETPMKTVLITGCSSGYGLETARHFHSQGWNVVATMRTPREDVLPRSARLRVLPLDVTKPESIAAALEASGPITGRRPPGSPGQHRPGDSPLSGIAGGPAATWTRGERGTHLA